MGDAHELSVSRYIAAPPAAVWQAMTMRFEEWWCPLPWRTRIVELDWRPGGRACMDMLGPDGEVMPNDGKVLDVVPGKRFVFTDAFVGDWQPAPAFMVGIFEIAPEGDGTRYTATARHWSAEACQQQREMGFEAGCAAAAAQLAALVEN